MARHGENIRKRSDGRWEARLLSKDSGGEKKTYRYFYGKTYEECKEKKLKAIAEERWGAVKAAQEKSNVWNTGSDHPTADSAANMAHPAVKSACLATHTAYLVADSAHSMEYPVHFKEFQPNSKESFSASKDILFGQLLEDWLHFTKSQVKESTFAKYIFDVHRHIEPALGNLYTSEINAGILEHFTQEKLTKGRLDGHGGLSGKMVNSLLSIIKLSLQYGQMHGICVDSVRIRNVHQPLPKIAVFPPNDLKILEAELVKHDENYVLGIWISLYAGLRIGEVCGLQWGDISFEDGVLRVQRTAMRIQNTDQDGTYKTRFLLETPKTETSRRVIPLPGFLLNLLKQRRTESACFVLTGTFSPMEPRIYYRKYKKILAQCQLQGYNYHALRHTFATRCVECGFDIKSLSEILGHADVNITLKRYVHPSMNLKREHMERLANSLVLPEVHGHEEGGTV